MTWLKTGYNLKKQRSTTNLIRRTLRHEYCIVWKPLATGQPRACVNTLSSGDWGWGHTIPAYVNKAFLARVQKNREKRNHGTVYPPF